MHPVQHHPAQPATRIVLDPKNSVDQALLHHTEVQAPNGVIAPLADPKITRVAIANPKHAPYGKRAAEALQAAGVWDKVEPKLVYGENIAHTAQFVQTGNADVGIIALSLALAPAFAGTASYTLIPDEFHQPLRQGFVILKRGEGKELAKAFAAFFWTADGRKIMSRYGFSLPGGTAAH